MGVATILIMWPSPVVYFFFFHYSQKLSHDICFQITNSFWEKQCKFENGVTFVEGQIMTLTFDIHVASLNHLVQCSYQLWDQAAIVFEK